MPAFAVTAAPAQFILKVASRCNFDCTYCHWFRDPEVRSQPARMTPAVFDKFLVNLVAYSHEHSLEKVSLILHGGEPLLSGKKAMAQMGSKIRTVEQVTGLKIDVALTTNGALVDKEWADLFRTFGISPCISVDGPPSFHDSRRIDLQGNPTHDKVRRGIEILQENGFPNLSLLAVADTSTDPIDTYHHFVHELGVSCFDVLIPNIDHTDGRPTTKPDLADYYIRLFDHWYADARCRPTKIRFFESIISELLGRQSKMSGVGGGPMATIALLADGSIQPHDALRIAGATRTDTGLNVMKSELSDILNNELWLQVYRDSIVLPEACTSCRHKHHCHGGYLIHRYSPTNGYRNPSVYCDDLLRIYDHVWNTVSQDVLIAS